ncbi:MAG: carboxymuconolactone decarboxylase family protein [Acidobacteria bacterium]|nr:carboxymuconolactone decarboxylase family protein [Acidobacteriota bacterium]
MVKHKKKIVARSEPTRSTTVPKTYYRFAERFPRLAEAHSLMKDAAEQSGPLDAKTCELIKMGIALGADRESSFHSHVRRALEHGATQAEVEQAIVLAMTTCGFSRAVAGWKWAASHF